jgi:hypothetical protein
MGIIVPISPTMSRAMATPKARASRRGDMRLIGLIGLIGSINPINLFYNIR